MHLLDYINPIAIYLRQSVLLTRLASHATMWLELYGGMLYVQPLWHEASSLVAFVMFQALHVGFLIALRVGLFAPACMAVHFGMMPRSVWLALGALFDTRERRESKLLYDAADPHTTVTAALLREWALPASVELLPARRAPKTEAADAADVPAYDQFANYSPQLCAMLSTDEMRRRRASLAVLAADGRGVHYPPASAQRWRALLAFAAWPRPLRAVAAPALAFCCETRLWRAACAYLHREACVAPPPRPVRGSRATRTRSQRWRHVTASGVVCALLGVSLYSALSGLQLLPHSETLSSAATALHVAQWWQMFAPQPIHSSVLFELHGTLADGTRTDLWDGGPPLMSVRAIDPALPVTFYFADSRWRRLASHLTDDEASRKRYVRWICTRWNSVGPGGENPDARWLTQVQLRRVLVVSPPPGFERGVDSKRQAQTTSEPINCPARPKQRKQQ